MKQKPKSDLISSHVATMELNDQILGLVQKNGLKAVVNAVSVACAREKQFAADDGEMGSEARVKAWEADETTVNSILPRIIHE